MTRMEPTVFRFRKPVILKKLAEEKPDVICFQEVLPHVAAWLKENLTEYTVVGCGRSETLEDEQMTRRFSYRPSEPDQYGNLLAVPNPLCAGEQI